MLFLYNLGIQLYRLLILLASLKSNKAAAWISGRKKILQHIATQIDTSQKHIWFHFASLGEFEQGRPVLEEIKSKYPKSAMVITFFSPSGYEVRKDYQLADHVFYLPLDTRKNAKEFVRLVKPSIAIFTKYEYWYHYFNELNQNKVPLFIISGLFRNNQPFFRWYGGLHRRMLLNVSHFFVQNELSKTLLSNLGIYNVSVTGDTRFDRVVKNMRQIKEIPGVKKFCSDYKILVAGSTWPQDEELIAALSKHYKEWKFIIAPHEVNPEHIRNVEKLFLNSVKISNLDDQGSDKQVLIVDNIGMLSSLYQYGHVAYVGGGFGVGIHNIQEPAVFGLPIIFGPNYHNFQEAKDLIVEKSAYSITGRDDLFHRMNQLENDDIRAKSGIIAKKYVLQKAGATQIILDYLEKENLLNQP